MSADMQVSVEALEGLARKMTVEVPVARINDAVTERLASLTKTVRMDGFRPGKVPLKVLRKRFGLQVRAEIMGEVIQSSFQQAVSEEELAPAGMPQIEALPETEAVFRYSATFEVYPQIDLQSLASSSVERVSAEVGDADIDDMLENLRKQRTHFHTVERAAEDGDQVKIDFAGFGEDGEALENASAEGFQLVLGNDQLIPGFEQQLLGARAGDERELSLNFPDDYKPDELAGTPVTFKVTVHEVGAPHTPEIDDEFAKAFGVEDGGVEALREKVRGNMERELRQAVRARLKSQAMDALLDANEVMVPAALVQQEIARLKQQVTQGADLELSDEPFQQEAERRVKLGLLVAEIVKQHELSAPEDKVRETVEEIAAPYDEPQQVVNYYYGNQELLGNVEAMVLEEQVVGWLLSQVQVTDVQHSFKDVMQPPAAPDSASDDAQSE